MKKFKDRVVFKGYKHKGGIVHFRNITIDDLRQVFFPKDFWEKYGYLGSVPWNEEGRIFKAMEPLVIFMDQKAKPKFCPRWFLRLLHLFGSDKSIVRVRNRKMHDLLTKLTKGYMIWDYKTKWNDYDLRISIAGNEQMNFLCRAIESKFYNEGLRESLAERIKELYPDSKFNAGYDVSTLQKELDRLEGDDENQKEESEIK
jgi:hypothetical protein